MKTGILIIGSLLWDESREAWRGARLDMNSAEAVTAPIRYGRRSQTRGNTYTMVFSKSSDLGRAVAIHCLHSVTSVDELTLEAEHLWAAEQNTDLTREISAGWGCVTLLRNPERDIPQAILTGWAHRISHERNYGNVPQLAGEGRLVSVDGLLQIPWPQRAADNEAVPLDLLLATATRPTLTGMPLSYPTVQRIADAWNCDCENNVQYFWRNNDHGIRTFQDSEIGALLHARRF